MDDTETSVRLESAAKMFFLTSNIARILSNAHKQQCKWDATVEMKMTPGSPNPACKNDLPKPTGGYEIHIVIHPPEKQLGPAATNLP